MTGKLKASTHPVLIWGALCATLVGCASTVVMPEVDLNDSQWRVWTGQALWEPDQDQPAVVGEILLALHQNGDTYIQLAKPPLVIFSAQVHGRSWLIDLIEKDKSYSGGGDPPEQFIWFFIPQVLADRGTLGSSWHVEMLDGRDWSFRSDKSGETIRLVLDE